MRSSVFFIEILAGISMRQGQDIVRYGLPQIGTARRPDSSVMNLASAPSLRLGFPGPRFQSPSCHPLVEQDEYDQSDPPLRQTRHNAEGVERVEPAIR